MTPLEAALSYARRHRWLVFPVHSIDDNGCCTCANPNCARAGKHPRTARGVFDASSDEATIRAWWERWPTANVGLATGAPSGVVALDVDPRHGGDATLAALEAEHGPLPATPINLTGGGGRHLLFRAPAARLRSRAGHAPGIDVRADGAYIVLPPSVHKSAKQYEWASGRSPDEVDLVDMPAWLQMWLSKRQENAPSQPVVTEPGAIVEGARNVTLFRLASALRRHATRDEILAALRVVNQRRCQPPLDDAELERIAHSAARYGPIDETPAPSRSDPPRLLSASEILQAADAPEPDWLVEGLLPSGGVSLLVGRPESGKSTLARALAVAAVQGRPFLGREVRKGPVLLVSLEDRPKDVGRHLRMMRLREDDALLVATALDNFARVAAWVKDHRPALVVIDTIGRRLPAQDQNAYAEVTKALDILLRLARESGAHLILLHHAPKGSDERDPIDAPLGSTAFAGMADTVLHLKRMKSGEDEIRTLASVQRVGEDMPESVVILRDGWPALVGPRTDVIARRTAEAVLTYVRAHPGASRQEVLDEVEGKAAAKVAALSLLLDEGRLARTGSGKKSDPFQYFVVENPADRRDDKTGPPGGGGTPAGAPRRENSVPVPSLNAGNGIPKEAETRVSTGEMPFPPSGTESGKSGPSGTESGGAGPGGAGPPGPNASEVLSDSSTQTEIPFPVPDYMVGTESQPQGPPSRCPRCGAPVELRPLVPEEPGAGQYARCTSDGCVWWAEIPPGSSPVPEGARLRALEDGGPDEDGDFLAVPQ